MRWHKMNMGFGRNPLGDYRRVIGACFIVSGTLLLTQVLPFWVGTLLFGTTLVVAGIVILRS